MGTEFNTILGRVRHGSTSWRVGVTCAFVTISLPALAGPIGMIGALYNMLLVYAGVVFVASLAALWACKYVANRRLRALLRLLILVVVYTPVPVVQQPGVTQIAPAFLLVFAQTNYWPHDGLLSHPISLAYGVTLLLFLPVVMLWMWLGERHRGDRATSQAQRTSVPSNASAKLPATNVSQ